MSALLGRGHHANESRRDPVFVIPRSSLTLYADEGSWSKESQQWTLKRSQTVVHAEGAAAMRYRRLWVGWTRWLNPMSSSRWREAGHRHSGNGPEISISTTVIFFKFGGNNRAPKRPGRERRRCSPSTPVHISMRAGGANHNGRMHITRLARKGGTTLLEMRFWGREDPNRQSVQRVCPGVPFSTRMRDVSTMRHARQQSSDASCTVVPALMCTNDVCLPLSYT